MIVCEKTMKFLLRFFYNVCTFAKVEGQTLGFSNAPRLVCKLRDAQPRDYSGTTRLGFHTPGLAFTYQDCQWSNIL